MFNDITIVRGGGDIATGIIYKLYRSGFKKIVILEVEQPTNVRRSVSLGNAVYDGEVIIEDIKAVRVNDVQAIKQTWKKREIPVIIDPKCTLSNSLKADVIVDAIIAKKNMGLTMDMADITVAVGPGFYAGVDVDAVVETSRGHDLGRVILEGSAKENSGIPGVIAGYGKERVIKSPCAGIFESKVEIGELVKANQVIGYIDNSPVITEIDGVLRGVVKSGLQVTEGFKIGDVDPRSIVENCFTISDKARAVGGGVLEAILKLKCDMLAH